jgi:hypothetical protein
MVLVSTLYFVSCAAKMPVAPLPLQKFARQLCCGLVGDDKLRIRNGLVMEGCEHAAVKLIFLQHSPKLNRKAANEIFHTSRLLRTAELLLEMGKHILFKTSHLPYVCYASGFPSCSDQTTDWRAGDNGLTLDRERIYATFEACNTAMGPTQSAVGPVPGTFSRGGGGG